MQRILKGALVGKERNIRWRLRASECQSAERSFKQSDSLILSADSLDTDTLLWANTHTNTHTDTHSVRKHTSNERRTHNRDRQINTQEFLFQVETLSDCFCSTVRLCFVFLSLCLCVLYFDICRGGRHTLIFCNITFLFLFLLFGC